MMMEETEKSTTQLLETPAAIDKKEPTLSLKPRQYQELIYKLCKEHYPGIITMAKIFLDRTKNQYDNHVSVEGGTGSGKSMFTFILVHVIHYLNDTTFKMNKQILFIPDQGELKKEFHNLKENDVMWLDEAIRALDKKQWYKIDQQDLNHIVKTERYKQNTIFYLIQRFAEFTETFRNDNIKFRIYIVPRYAAVLYIKDDDKDIEDPWHNRENLSIKYRNSYTGQTRYKAVMTPQERLAKEKKLPNYFCDSPFPDLSRHEVLKEYWNYYKFLKEESRRRAREKAEKEGEIKAMSKYEKKYKELYGKKIREEWNEKKLKNPRLTRQQYLEELGHPFSMNRLIEFLSVDFADNIDNNYTNYGESEENSPIES